MPKVAIYPGTFDPITFGHIDVIKKSLKIFDKIIVGVSDSENKNYLFDPIERKRIAFSRGYKYRLKDSEVQTIAKGANYG